VPLRLTRSRRRIRTVEIPVDELNANPFPIWRQLRKDNPVAYAPAIHHYWFVTRWDDVATVLKDDDTFSARIATGMLADLANSILFSDGSEHSRMRAAMQAPCQPQAVQAFVRGLVPGVADELIDSFAANGSAELMGAYFEPLAAETLKALSGLDMPTADLRVWVDHVGDFFSVRGDSNETRRVDEGMSRVINGQLGPPPRAADSTLLRNMTEWRDADGALPEQQLRGSLKVFLAAGLHELRDLMAHALLGLLSRPEQLLELEADLSLARPAIEEAARWASPVGMVPRATTGPVELAGVRIPAGAYVAAIVASANRDERRFTEPSRFDLHRDEGMHIAFASGVHFCLGAWLSRDAGATALARLVERLPGLRLTPGEPIEVRGWRFREVNRLHATWT
jgi:cytochrome P450